MRIEMYRAINSAKVIRVSGKSVSENMDFLCQVSFLGVCQGFHEKMIRDAIDTVKNLPTLDYKQKKREVKRMYDYDPFILKCTKVVNQCQVLLNNFRYYVDDSDLKKIWLVIDKFLHDTVLQSTFISAVGSFSLVSCDLLETVEITDTQIIEDYKKLQGYLYEVGLEISNEYFEMRKEKMEKAGKEYDRFVFSFFENKENEKAVKYGEHFLNIFKNRESFEKYAQTHFDSLQGDDKKYFDTIFRKLNEVA